MATQQFTALTVSELTAGVKAALEKGFSRIYLEGEISGWRVYPSGHAYFTLKDSAAQISAVMFASYLARCESRHPGIREQLKDGARVIVCGSVTVYPPRGQYQITVFAAKLAGVGDLMQRYLELKAKLEAEGLFAVARKRTLPFLPRRIGLVTSEAGAVFHDMCTVIHRRFPAVEIRLFPSLVQGVDAPRTLIAGLNYFSECPDWRADVVILARGGGSFEDLFCFNDEALVRAVAACKVPVISAVGHQTDNSLCDFAADVRAGTPSIAAELVVPIAADLRNKLNLFSDRLRAALEGRGHYYAQRIDQLDDMLAATLKLALADVQTRLANLMPRLVAGQKHLYATAEGRLEKVAAQMNALSPFAVLSRGYSITTDASGAVIRRAADVTTGVRLTTRTGDGSFQSVVC